MHLYGENIENSVSQNELKTNSWNLPMYDQSSIPVQLQSKFCPPGLFALAPGLYTCIKSVNL